jgi:hypothetical protein
MTRMERLIGAASCMESSRSRDLHGKLGRVDRVSSAASWQEAMCSQQSSIAKHVCFRQVFVNDWRATAACPCAYLVFGKSATQPSVHATQECGSCSLTSVAVRVQTKASNLNVLRPAALH